MKVHRPPTPAHPQRVLAILALIALLAASCSSGAGGAPSVRSTTTGPDGSGYPVTIDSAVGAVTITQKPQRVVTIGWGSQDVALALGVVPVGMQDMTGNTGDDTGILPWDAPKLGGAKPTLIKYTTGQVPNEQIAALRPDVILAVDSGLTATEYGRLSKIAPTVGYPGKPWLTSWQDQVRIVGKALGQADRATALEKSTQQLINNTKHDHPEFAGKTIAFGSGTEPGNYNLYLATDSRVQLLAELGFSVASDVPKKAPSFAAQISLENLPTIDSDVLVAWYLSPQVQRSIEHNRLFQQVPAVKRHGYVPITDPALVYATSAVSVLSLPWMLDRYAPMLSQAANGTLD